MDSRLPPRFTLGKDPGTNVPQSASHLHVTWRVHSHVGPLDLPDPKLDLPFTSVYIHHFLTIPQPCFPTSSTDLGFSCWQTLENQWKSCHVFKGKIHNGNNYAKYSGIVTTREMLTLIIPKGQQSSNNQQVQKSTGKVASGHPIQCPSISSRCIAEWWFVTPTLLASCAAENDRTPSVFDAFANIVVLEKVLSKMHGGPWGMWQVACQSLSRPVSFFIGGAAVTIAVTLFH